MSYADILEQSNTITAIGRGLTSQRFELEQEGEKVAGLRMSFFGRYAELTIGEEVFGLQRQGFAGRRYFLMRGDRVLASAARTGFFRKDFDIEIGSVTIRMHRPKLIGSSFFVVDENDREIGCLEQFGVMRMRATVDLPPEWPLPVQAFLLWIALRAWLTERSASV